MSKGFAEEAIKKLNTSSGLLFAREAIGKDCGSEATFAQTCTALYLNDEVILSEYQLSIDRVFPSKKEPQLVSISTSTGGNACCWENYIFDFTQMPPVQIKGFSFGAEISRTIGGVVFQMPAGENALGDQLVGTYKYELGSGRPVQLRTVAKREFSPLESKKSAAQILGDQKLRAPIVKVIGTEKFKEFRFDLGISGPPRRVESIFVVGSGCRPHSCGGSGPASMFVLDTQNNLAWAVHSEEDLNERPTAKVWGALTPADIVPLHEIRQWLAEKRIPEGRVSFVTLPDNITQLYKRPRATTSKDEVSSASSHGVTIAATEKAFLPQTLTAEHAVIPLQREGGTFVVPVSINGALTLKFTVDSGAADVSMPADVVMTLLRTGTLSDDDFLGKKTYRLADGSTVPSQTFRIRSLKVGDRVLENVTGSVASVAGSLLLGQSFLGRFKSWSIDNNRQILLLE